MENYVIYVGTGEVLGAAEADDPLKAAQAVVDNLDLDPDTFGVEVNVATVDDEDVEVGDELDTTQPGVEVVETGRTVVPTT